jgi:uncharacterized membrane protein YtjA (UPF0391 family)
MTPPQKRGAKAAKPHHHPEESITGVAGYSPTNPPSKEYATMLRWAIIFLIIAIIAAPFGFGLFANYTWEAAKIVFVVFIVLALLCLSGALYQRGSA